jgi:hypothetical protein
MADIDAFMLAGTAEMEHSAVMNTVIGESIYGAIIVKCSSQEQASNSDRHFCLRLLSPWETT